MYRNFAHDNANVVVIFLLFQKQQDCHNCGLFAVAFNKKFLDGKSPIGAVYVSQLRNHLIYSLESGALTLCELKYRTTLLAASLFGTWA